MIVDNRSSEKRSLKKVSFNEDLVIVGGGLSGVCGAIQAARQGLKVVLVQDRPVLGGNSSSEVRLWVLGATSHMGNNNRWAREGGVINEILVENTYRNPEGNALIFDTILLEKVKEEENITLLLNTSVYHVEKSSQDKIESLLAFCSQNSTEYELKAPLFCDASGDGIIGFLSGAAFRMGAESKDEFDEAYAPDKEYGELLGHTIYFYSKDTGKPVNFVPPSFALDDITKIPRYKSFNAKEDGCRLWWIEYGGRLDTVHDTEEIKWELWKVIYGVWNHIKNSGEFEGVENLTLEWVGTIPGKRESRRFEGPIMLTQKDIVEQKTFEDAVSFGGWAIDLHPADGVYSEKPGCNQWHSKGVYQIPYRTMYSKNIKNLFLAGRVISSSHIAFGSTRVMGTSAHSAQAVGAAAVLCKKYNLLPDELISENKISELQQELLKSGHYIPGIAGVDDENLVSNATITASSLSLSEFKFNGEWKKLVFSSAQMLPVAKGKMPTVTLPIKVEQKTTVEFKLKISSDPNNHTPEIVLGAKSFQLDKGGHSVELAFEADIPADQYVFVCIEQNDDVSVGLSDTRVTGVLSSFKKINKAVSNYGVQEPPADAGFDTFEMWTPERRPEGKNLALQVNPAITAFSTENLTNGFHRPVNKPNAWVAALSEEPAELKLNWETPQSISSIELCFDTDYDHPMESSLMGHPENIMPFVVRNFIVLDQNGNQVGEVKDNHQSINVIKLDSAIEINELTFRFERPSEDVPVSVFEIRCCN